MAEGNRRENMKRRDSNSGETKGTSRRRPSSSASERVSTRIPIDVKPQATVETQRKRPSATAAERIVEHIPAHRPVASNPAPVEPRPASTAKKSGCCMLTMLGMLGAGAGIISLLAAIF